MTVTSSPPQFALCNCGFSHGPSLDRRRFLVGGAATLALGAAASSGFMAEAMAQTKPHRIDVHHHITPPAWLDALKSMKKDTPPVTNWSVQKTIEDMDAGGVATAMTSPTTPQLQGLDAPTAARVARESNEFAKKLEADHPGRFGTWAMLPLPHVDESLKAIEYAFDTLKVDGVGLLTSYDTKWLGDPAFLPVFEELNRRKAVVYTHPLEATCCRNGVQGVTPQTLEYPTDTTRTLMSLVAGNTASRCPDVKFIFSHAGGTLVSIAGRFLGAAVSADSLAKPPEANSRMHHVRRFYYDTAGSANPVQMQSLKLLVPASQIVFGTDFPFANPAATVAGLETSGLTTEELRGVYRNNALKFLPKYA